MKTTIGGAFDIVTLDHAKNPNDEGFWPYVTGLAREGDGKYQNETKKINIENNTLVNINVHDAFISRGDNNGMLKNATPDSQGNYWNRKCLLIVNQEGALRTREKRLCDLLTILKLNNKLNKQINLKMGQANEYKIADLTNDYKSLDHYLRDHDVIEVLKEFGDNLSATWAKDNEMAAKIFFDPNHSYYPPEARWFGYENKFASMQSDNSASEDENEDISMDELKKYM